MASAVREVCAWWFILCLSLLLSPVRRAWALTCDSDGPAARDGVAPLRVRRARAPLGRADWARHAAARPHHGAGDVLHLGAHRRAGHVRGDVADGGTGCARAELGRECVFGARGGV
ncbi:hypothetical protein DFH09DRAFT_1190769, partial [Mycena vulgaris]